MPVLGLCLLRDWGYPTLMGQRFGAFVCVLDPFALEPWTGLGPLQLKPVVPMTHVVQEALVSPLVTAT